MAEPQTQHRPPLDFPPAITIRAGLFPPPSLPNASQTPTSLYPTPTPSSASADISGSNAIPLGIPKNRYPPNYTSWQNWKEWHINPTQHGPEGSTGPPIFVPSTLKYDELGRSVIDGVGVEVSDGRETGEEREDGAKIAGWYSSLARSGLGEENAEAGPSKLRQVSEGIIDLTGDDEDDDLPLSESKPTVAPIRVHRSEWFIRRALLKSASSLSTPPTISRPKASISTLLNIPPQVNRAKEPMYVLGRDHIGHKILRERLGWGGGGLGKPEGWEPTDTAEHERREEEPVKAEGSKENVIVISDSEDPDSETESEISVDEPTIAGPGRTAPIATTLKLDRLGLGHRLSADRPGRKGKGKAKAVMKEGEGRKKVTHSHEEIMEAQRRARYSRSGHVQGKGPTGEVLGKKGKIKWKEKDKKERDERRRMIAALND